MAYNGYTQRGNPINADLHKEFTDHVISSQEEGKAPYPHYDAWYEAEKKVGDTTKNIYVNPKPK